MNDPRPSYRIVSARPQYWRRAAQVIGASGVLVLVGFALYRYVPWPAVADFMKPRVRAAAPAGVHGDLAQQLAAERATNVELRQQVVYAQRSTDIDGQACASVKDSLAGLQAEAADLREQVAFYRGIVSPDETRAGVRVLDLHVAPQTDARRWRYELVLIQSVRHDKKVSGGIQIRVLGGQDNTQVTLDLAKQLVGQAKLPTFAFKYFQEFSGEFQLPAGFRPLRMTVTLTVDGQPSLKVEDERDWSKIREEKSPS